MPDIQVIGISGKARAGKDTVARLILKKVGGTHYSFAQPIYAMLAAIGFDFKSPDWEDLKETPIAGLGKSPRQMLQTLGTEWGRQQVHPDLWLMLADRHLDYRSKLIISDVRFENEADWVRRNGILLRVIRPQAPDVAPHVSETGITPREGDIQIDNSGSLVDLTRLVNLVIEHVIET